MHLHFLYNFIIGAAASPFLFAAAIMIGVFFVEDPTTIIVGLLAADHIISIPLALASLYAGIIFGDILLYGIGWLASKHPWFARYVDHEMTAPFRGWLETRFAITVFSARFIPGARFPTYTTSGFFGSPLGTFILVVTAAASVWTTALFAASYWFGTLTTELIGPVRWGIAAIFLIILFFIGRHNVLASRFKQGADTSADTRTP